MSQLVSPRKNLENIMIAHGLWPQDYSLTPTEILFFPEIVYNFS